METDRSTARPAGAAGAVLAALAAALLAVSGCGGDDADDLSGPEHLLKIQVEAWNKAQESMRSGQPDLNLLRSIDYTLRGGLKRQIQNAYNRENKQQVLAKLDELQQTWISQVVVHLDKASPVVKLRSGSTIDQVRDAFSKMDPAFQQFAEMTR